MPIVNDRYLVAYNDAQHRLEAEIAYHRSQSSSMFLPVDMKAKHVRIRIRLSADRLDLEREHGLVWSKLLQVQAPPASVAESAERHAGDLARVLVNSAEETAILGGVTNFLTAWAKLKNFEQA